MRFVFGMMAGLTLLAGPVLAEGAASGRLPADVPEKTQKRMREAPEAFLTDAADMILGFGRDGGINRAGIEDFIAMDRAKARAGVMGQLMAGDLDGDGAASAAEVTVLVGTLAADRRGRAALGFAAADTDGDGAVTAAEMTAEVAMAGANAVSPAKVAALLAMMTLDLDKDGTLTLDEAREAVKRANEAA
jgi:EF hand